MRERRLLLDKLLSNRKLDGASVPYEIVKPLRVLSEMRFFSLDGGKQGIKKGHKRPF
jgi:hypothetical protein